MKFVGHGSSPWMGEVRRGRQFAVWLLCGESPSPSPSRRGRGSSWSVLWGFIFINRVFDNCEDSLEIIANFRVPKAQDAKTLTCKKLVTNFVGRTIQMLTAISFNNNFIFKAYEVKHVSTHRLLPTKLSTKMFTAQQFPKNAFFWSHIPSQFSGYVFHRHNFHYELAEGI